MARPNKPWYRAQTDAWVVKIGGKQHTLARGKRSKAEAQRAFHELMGKLGRAEVPAGDLPAWALADTFLDHVKADLSDEAFRFYRQRLRQFLQAIGRDRPAGSVQAIDLIAWANGEHEWRKGREIHRGPWNESTRANGITAVKVCWEWGRKHRLISSNPLADVSRSQVKQAKAYLPAEDLERIIQAAEGSPRAILEFLRETGCRPSEAARIEAAHVDLAEGIARLPGKTSRATKKPRTIYLTDRAREILRGVWRPSGPLFLNLHGRPWTLDSLRDLVDRMGKKAGLPFATTKCFRHGFTTDALMKGMSSKIVAELLGHTTTAMVDRHYAHLSERREEMRAAAERARRKE